MPSPCPAPIETESHEDAGKGVGEFQDAQSISTRAVVTEMGGIFRHGGLGTKIGTGGTGVRRFHIFPPSSPIARGP